MSLRNNETIDETESVSGNGIFSDSDSSVDDGSPVSEGVIDSSCDLLPPESERVFVALPCKNRGCQNWKGYV